MHDISHHIELPAHIEDVSCRKKLEEAVGLTTGKKGTKRTVDYPRCSLITTSCYVRATASPREQHLLNTMVDIQDILYRQDKFRSPRLILRFHNSSWYHHTFRLTTFISEESPLNLTMQSAELFLPTVHGLVEKLLISTMQCCYRLCVIERTCIPQTYYICYYRNVPHWTALYCNT